jgi:acetyl-CoA C-acetyltransferase
MTRDVVIVDGVRTTHGVFGGQLKEFTAQRLGVLAVDALLKRNPQVKPGDVEELIFGCVVQNSDAPNIARVIGLLAGVPKHVPGYTVQRNCSSGMQAIINACQHIVCGDRDIQIAGGTECMSAAPYVSRDMRWGKRLRHAEFIDTVWEGLTDPVVNQIMGRTAENLVEEFSITRQEQDRFAVQSHQRAFRATREGKFKAELVPVMIPKKAFGKELPPEPMMQDEGINPALTEQILGSYPTVFKEHGSVTPGNACFNADGAACVLMMSGEKAKSLGYKPLGIVRAYSVVGLEPERMGIGPALAVPVVLKKAGLSLKDIGLFEINEAFAATVLAAEKSLTLNHEIVNVNGGAIAIGHPVGQTGTRIIVTLLHEMARRSVQFGIATLCVGGGQGVAVLLERPS